MDKLDKMVLQQKWIRREYTNPRSNQAPQGCKNWSKKEQVLCCFHSPAASHAKDGIVSKNVSPYQIVFSQ
jgi:hypothetical protein